MAAVTPADCKTTEGEATMLMITRTLTAATALVAFTLTANLASAQSTKRAETAADHEAVAKTYTEKAEGYRKDAAWHKEMAESYSKAHPETKSAGANPWNAKMQKHCVALEKEAEKMAADSDKVAEFHTLRAKEVAGK